MTAAHGKTTTTTASSGSAIRNLCDQLIFGSLFALVTLYPLVANPFFAPVFTMFKLFVLRVIVLVMFSAWLIKTVKQREIRLVSHPLNLAVIFFFSLATLSTVFSINPLIAFFGEYARWEGLATLFSYGLIYLVVLNWPADELKIRYLIYGLTAGALIVSGIGMMEHFRINPILRYAGAACGAGFGALTPGAFTSRSFSTFGNAAFLGGYLALVFPVTVSQLLLADHTWKTRLFFLIAAGVTFGCWTFTLARAAWLGVAGGIALIAVLGWPRLKTNRFWIIQAVLVMLVIFLSVLVSPTRTGIDFQELASRLTSIIDTSIGTGGGNRLEMWKHTLPLIIDYPLLGTGPDTFKVIFTKYKPSHWTISYKNPQLDKPHNELFQLGATIGVFGAIAFVWIILLGLWKGIQSLASIDERSKPLLIGLIAGVLSYFINLQFVFSHLSVSPLLWLFLGLTIAITAPAGSSRAINKINKIRLPFSRQGDYLIIAIIVVVAVLLAFGSARLWQADVYFNRANSYQMTRDWPTILAAFEKAAELNPLSPDYQLYLGKAYGLAALSVEREATFQRYLSRSLEAFRKAESLNPLDESIFFNRGKIFLRAGRVLQKPSYLEKAVESYQDGLELNPNSGDAYLDLGAAYGNLNQLQSAIRAWEKTISIDGRNADAYYNLGWAYQKLRNLNRAKIYYRKALKLHEDCEIKNCPVCIDAKQALDEIEELENQK